MPYTVVFQDGRVCNNDLLIYCECGYIDLLDPDNWQ